MSDDDPQPITKDPAVLSWVAASFVAWFSDAALTVGLGWCALTTLDAGAAGVVVALSGAVRFITGFPGGVLADSHDPRKVIAASALAELVTLGAGTCLWTGGQRGPALFVLAAVFGAIAGLCRPARTTWMRSLVDDAEMPRAVAWSQIASRLAQFAGAPVGAFVVASRGFPGVLAVAAAGPAVVLITVWTLQPRLRIPRAAGLSLRSAFEGLAYLGRNHDARALVMGLSAANLGLIPLTSIGLAMVARDARWGPSWVGYGEAVAAVSALVATGMATRLTTGWPARASFVLIGVQGAAIPLVTYGFRATYLFGLMVIGGCAGIASVRLSALYLATIDPAYLGRVGCWIGALDLTLGPVITPVWTQMVSLTSLPGTGLTFGAAAVALAVALTVATWRVGHGSA